MLATIPCVFLPHNAPGLVPSLCPRPQAHEEEYGRVDIKLDFLPWDFPTPHAITPHVRNAAGELVPHPDGAVFNLMLTASSAPYLSAQGKGVPSLLAGGMGLYVKVLELMDYTAEMVFCAEGDRKDVMLQMKVWPPKVPTRDAAWGRLCLNRGPHK